MGQIVFQQATPGAVPYESSFNDSSDWTDATDRYEITVSAATHGRSLVCVISVQELIDSEYHITPNVSSRIDADENVTIAVSKSPDLRFAGRVRIL